MTSSTFRTIPVWLLASKIGSGKTPSGGAKTYLESGVTFLRSQNVYFDGLRLEDVAFIDRGTHAEMRGTKVRPDDVLLNITGASLGRVARFPAGLGAANVNQHVCIIRPNGGVDSRFLAYALASQPAQQQISSMQVGGNREGLNFEQVGHLHIPEVSAEEQRRIADFLDAETARIDALLEARDRQGDLLALHAASSLNDVMERLSRKYGAVRLRRVLMSMEQGWSPQCEDRYVGDGEWGVVKAGCVNSGKFDAMQHKALPSGVEPRREYKLRNGDLLMSRASGSPELIGSIGIVEGLDHQLLLCDKVYRLRVDRTRALAPFLAHALRCHSVREHIKLGISGAEGMANNLPTAVVMGCLIPDAPLASQNDVVAEREQEEETVKRMRASIGRASSLLAERRQSLITAAVTGQLDVTTAGRAAAV